MDHFSGDIELIHALHAGNGRAYSVIYERFIAQLNYFIMSITSDRQAAEDIASESFLKVFRRKNDFASVSDFKSFLFRVASNEALNYIKMQKRYRNHLGKWTEGQTLWTDDVHRKLIEAEAVHAVFSELQKLPQQVREVLRLSLFENRSLQEIAEQMNIATKTVKNHKTRGLAMLRDALSANKDLSPLMLVIVLNMLQAHS